MTSQPRLSTVALACTLAWFAQSLPTLSEPPTGAHAWRETDGLVVARNYCVEGASFWEPRVDNRGATDGRTGTEFPVLMWISGRVGCATGDYVTVWRALSFVGALLLAASLWGLSKRLFAAAPSALMVFATSPLTAYFSRSAQPDMVSAGLAAAALFLASNGRVWISAGVLGAAVLIKLPAVVYAVPVVWLCIRGRPERKWEAAAAIALSLIPAAAWYSHARALEAATGLANFGVTRSPSQLMAEWATSKFWVKNFVQWPFDVWVFPPVTVALLATVLWKRGRLDPVVPVLSFTVLAYLFLTGNSGAHHDYYGVLLLPALCLLAGWAIAQGVTRFPRRAWLTCALGAVLAVAYQLHRSKNWWPVRQAEWEALARFSHRELGPRGKGALAVFSEGNPRLFWFTGQVGHFSEAAQPVLEPSDAFAAVDRLRFAERSAALEAALESSGCRERFSNPVAWVCMR